MLSKIYSVRLACIYVSMQQMKNILTTFDTNVMASFAPLHGKVLASEWMSERVSVSYTQSVSLLDCYEDGCFQPCKQFQAEVSHSLLDNDFHHQKSEASGFKRVDIQQRSVVSRTSELKIIVKHGFFSGSFQRGADCVF